MNRARILAATALLAITALPACNGLHTPTAAEQGAKKMEQIGNKASAIARRVAFSPEAVAKTIVTEGGETKELAQTLLAPAEAAKELRTLANEVAGAGATDAQRRDAKVLASRMRRDALMLDLMDLERISQIQGGLARQIEERIAAIRSVEASGDLRAEELAAAWVAGAQGAKTSFDGMIAEEAKRADDAKAELKPLDAVVTEKSQEAESLDIEIQGLRAQAATSPPSKALPLMLDARAKLDQAQNLRTAVSQAESDAEPHRSTVRVAEKATAGNEAMESFLSDRMNEASKAQEGAKSRAGAARKRVMELAGEAAGLAKEFAAIQADLYQPALKSVSENFGTGDLASKNPTDAAMISLAKARLSGIQVDGIYQAMIIATATPAAGGSPDSGQLDSMRASRDTLTASAKASLIEARDALSGVDGASAKPIVAAIERMATTLGVDITKPAAPAAPAGDDAKSDAAATPADPGATPADPSAAPAEGSPAASPGTPEAAPGGDGAAPAPAEKPADAPADPAPAQDEPNK
jgi:hypothetical protein